MANPIVKVSARSRPPAVAGAIAGIIRERRHVDVQAIGAGAVNQAVKAIAIARNYLERDGLDIACVPSFVEREVDGNQRTAVRFAVEVNRTFTPVAPAVETPPRDRSKFGETTLAFC